MAECILVEIHLYQHRSTEHVIKRGEGNFEDYAAEARRLNALNHPGVIFAAHCPAEGK